jgi:protein-S-isoprenylcysteine O-methyltransferase Ste14
MVDGPGGSGFITGARWGAMAGALVLLIVVHVQVNKHAGEFDIRHPSLRWMIGVAVALAVAALITGVLRAG